MTTNRHYEFSPNVNISTGHKSVAVTKQLLERLHSLGASVVIDRGVVAVSPRGELLLRATKGDIVGTYLLEYVSDMFNSEAL